MRLSNGGHSQVLSRGNMAIGNSPVTVYTVPDNSTVEIQTCIICTAGGGAPTFLAFVIEPGGSASVSNQVIPTRTLVAKEVLPLNDIISGGVYEAGTKIAFQTNISNVVSWMMTGTIR